MKKLLIALCLTLAAGAVSAKDEKTPSPKQLEQQQRMKDCNAQAKEKGVKGKDARNQFMSQCLKPAKEAEEPKKELKPQQQKMADCNKQAKEKGVKGKEDRNQFMSECLKGDKK